MSSDPISSGDEYKLELFYDEDKLQLFNDEDKLQLFNDEVSQDMSIALNLAAPTAFRLDDENRSTAGTRWPEWCSELEMFLVASGVKDGAQKKAVLLFVAGSEVRCRRLR